MDNLEQYSPKLDKRHKEQQKQMFRPVRLAPCKQTNIFS